MTSRWAEVSLIGLYLASWGLLLYATFLINHFDLFGLRQVWFALRDFRTIAQRRALEWCAHLFSNPTIDDSQFLRAL